MLFRRGPRALAVNGALAITQNDSRAGRPLLEKGLALGRRLENIEVALFSLRYLTISAVYDDELPEARECAERGLRLARRAGSQAEMAHLFTAVGGTAAVADDHDRAEPMLQVLSPHAAGKPPSAGERGDRRPGDADPAGARRAR